MSGNNIPPPSFGGLSGPTIRRFLGGFVQTSLGGMPFAVNGMLMLRTDGLNQATAIQDMDMDTPKNTATNLENGSGRLLSVIYNRWGCHFSVYLRRSGCNLTCSPVLTQGQVNRSSCASLSVLLGAATAWRLRKFFQSACGGSPMELEDWQPTSKIEGESLRS